MQSKPYTQDLNSRFYYFLDFINHGTPYKNSKVDNFAFFAVSDHFSGLRRLKSIFGWFSMVDLGISLHFAFMVLVPISITEAARRSGKVENRLFDTFLDVNDCS